MATEKLNSRVAVHCIARTGPRRIGRAEGGKRLASRERCCSLRYEECLSMFSGGPAIVEPCVGFLRPVALRPHLSVSLPFSVASTFVSLYVSPVSGNVPTGETAERRGLSGVLVQEVAFGWTAPWEGRWRDPVLWQPRCRRTLSLRPVALRPRLSTSLPLSVTAVLRAVESGCNR